MYSGAEEALVVPYDNVEKYHGEDGFRDVSFVSKPDIKRVSQEKAWSVFSRMSKVLRSVELHSKTVIARPNLDHVNLQADPGSVTLVALGPLTNLAIALLADPDLSSRLKHLYVMGGNTEVSEI